MTTIQSICEHYGIPVADTIDAFNNSGKAYDDLSSDGVHPNDAGQESTLKLSRQLLTIM